MYQIDTFELNTARVALFRLKAGCVVRVTGGRLWMTHQGQAEDIWLGTGEHWTLPMSDVLYLSAEPTVTFQIAQVLPQQKAPHLQRNPNTGLLRFIRSKLEPGPHLASVISY